MTATDTVEVFGDSSEFDANWWNTMLCSALAPEVAPKGIIYVGAHIGEHVPLFASCGFAPIMCIEPNPEAFAALEAAAGRVASVDCVNVALSDRDGACEYFGIRELPTLNSILEPDRDYWIGLAGQDVVDQQVMDRTEVSCAKLDTLLGSRASAYNILYMNTQGSEHRVLDGSAQSLAHIDVIFTEVNFARRYAGCALFPELDERLRALGFANTYLWRYRDGNFTHGEAIYSRAASGVGAHVGAE